MELGPITLAWNVVRRIVVRAVMGRLDVRVRAHEATLQHPYVADAVFINVTNHSPRRSAKPTHVTVLTARQVAVVNALRPLRTLAPGGDSWETWIVKHDLPDPTQDIRGLVEVRLSTGERLMSTLAVPGVDLPVAGAVPQLLDPWCASRCA
jgi:hypothetical protein